MAIKTVGVKVNGSHSAAWLRLDRVVVIVILLVLGALTLAAPLFVGVSGMRTTGCQSSCDTSLVGVGGAVIIYGCLGVTVVALVALLLVPRSGRYLWWLPCSALIAEIATVLLGNHLIDLGVGG